jgi:N-acylneuraminate cytidylyltransferase
MEDKTFYGTGLTFYPIDWKAAIDIDNYEDVEFAQGVFNMLHKSGLSGISQEIISS